MPAHLDHARLDGRLQASPGGVASTLVAALVTSILLGLLPFRSAAQEPIGLSQIVEDPRFRQAETLFEGWLDAKMAYEQIPGMSVALVHDQDLVWARGYGLAHREAGVPATPETLYSVCSISKLFTSIGVMHLRDMDRLSLRDPVSDLLPWYDLEETFDGGPVTVEGVLTHSSGLPRETAHSYWTGPDHQFPTQAEIVDGLAGQETLYPARQYFQYSNLGMALAGQIVEHVSGVEYASWIQENILNPLGMKDTYVDIPEEHRSGRFATGYTRIKRSGKRDEAAFFQTHGIAAAAGYASTVEDLARFASWQFRLLEKGGAEILDINTLREMHRVHWVDPDFESMWGLGFAVSQSDGERTVGHGGSCPGFRSTFQMIPGEKLAGIVMINALANPGQVWNALRKTLGAAVDDILEDPDGGAAARGDDGLSLTAYEGLYESTWGETLILRWKDGLAGVGLPTNDPVEDLSELRHIAGDTFRRVRDDGELGEEYIFHRIEGSILSYSVHGNFSRRVQPSSGGT